MVDDVALHANIGEFVLLPQREEVVLLRERRVLLLVAHKHSQRVERRSEREADVVLVPSYDFLGSATHHNVHFNRVGQRDVVQNHLRLVWNLHDLERLRSTSYEEDTVPISIVVGLT